MASVKASFKAFKTVSIPAAKPLKLTIPKPPKMAAMKLPTMKTGGTPKLSVPSIAHAAVAKAPSIRSTPLSSRIAYAASSSSPGALGVPPAGFRKQRDQAL